MENEGHEEMREGSKEAWRVAWALLMLHFKLG